MNIDYKLSVMASLGEFGNEFARTRTLSTEQILKLLQMLELQIQVMEDEAVCQKSKSEYYARLYKVITSC